MKVHARLVRENTDFAQLMWGCLPRSSVAGLEALIQLYRFSVPLGDVIYLENRWYVTHAGLLRLASRKRCVGIRVSPVREFCNAGAGRWAFKATVYRSRACKGFTGYGDADPSNVSALVRGAEMRMAETRAVNRALRKAYGIGICSVEEIGSLDRARVEPRSEKIPPQPANGNYGGPKVRDRLCQLIRKHELDASLVKSYAVDFCGTKT